MKYCTKCGHQIIEDAKFCNACGAAVSEATAPQAPKTDDELRAEEQALLNKFSLGLKHERMAWKFAGIFYIISTIVIAFCALLIGVCAVAIDDYDSVSSYFFYSMANVYFILALCYLPIAIINLSMKNKLKAYREKLYTDCKDGIGHFSVGSIVFCGFFNTVAMVFNIVYFIQAKNNAAVIERIKARQEEYNSRQ